MWTTMFHLMKITDEDKKKTYVLFQLKKSSPPFQNLQNQKQINKNNHQIIEKIKNPN